MILLSCSASSSSATSAAVCRRFFFLASRFIRQVYLFDGSTGVMVPPEAMTHNLTRNFTISLWLKHEHHAGQDKHVKEHILCNADDHRESSLAAH